jgi:Tol biopolymer transport system component
MVDVSPVASQLAYVTDRRGPQEIWVTGFAANISGPQSEHPADQYDRPLMTPAALTVDGEPAQFFMNPVFSPDGRRVAIVAKTRAGVQLYTVFASGGAPVRATIENGVFENAPTWSPDGNWLAFVRETKSDLTLAKVRPGSGEATVDIGRWAGSSAVPGWSPSGEWIAYNSPGGLALISPDGKDTRKLPGDSGPVAWSRDSKTLYQARSEPPALFAIDIASGKDRQLRTLEGLLPFTNLNPGLRISLTPDGKSLVYTVNHPRREIWILDGLQIPKAWALRVMGR